MSAPLSLPESAKKALWLRRVCFLCLATPVLAIPVPAIPAPSISTLAAGTQQKAEIPEPTATAAGTVAEARRQIEAIDYQVSGRLDQNSGGARKSSNFTMKAKWFPDGLHLFSEITSPADARNRILVVVTPAGRESIQMARPGDKAAKTIPVEEFGDPLLGSNFSIEDLVDAQFFWQKQTLLPDAKYGARDCLVLKSESGPGDRTHYASVTSWIDKKIHAVVHVEKVQKSGPPKEFLYYGLRQVSGVWSASQIEAKVQGSTNSSLLILERGSAKANLARKDFDPALLIKP
jgi:hypothetical protein